MSSVFPRLTALILLIFASPLIAVCFILVKLESSGPFIFRQKRAGKDKKPFVMYKIRTMVEDAQNLKEQYLSLNESDGPVFKIKDDPRYTRVGKFLSHSGLDEILQLINVIKGEMAFVGPRPLPVEEAKNVPDAFKLRFSVLPGLTSRWILNGAHLLKFQKWMELDTQYVKEKSLFVDFKIVFLSAGLILKLLAKEGSLIVFQKLTKGLQRQEPNPI